MTTPSGQISMSDILTVINAGTQRAVSFNENDVRWLTNGNATAGATVAMSNMRSKPTAQTGTAADYPARLAAYTFIIPVYQTITFQLSGGGGGGGGCAGHYSQNPCGTGPATAAWSGGSQGGTGGNTVFSNIMSAYGGGGGASGQGQYAGNPGAGSYSITGGDSTSGGTGVGGAGGAPGSWTVGYNYQGGAGYAGGRANATYQYASTASYPGVYGTSVNLYVGLGGYPGCGADGRQDASYGTAGQAIISWS